jgi:Protein of unknown function (DUF3043)
VRVFRRRSADAAGSPAPKPGPPGQNGGGPAGAAANGTANGTGGEPDRASVTAGKGRPTPKRSEAERRRRQPFSAPADRKAAVAQTRGRDREARNRKYAAMRRGEEWALAAKDRGPVRALARDYVDSRRRISEYYMYGLGVLVVLLFIPATRLIVDYLVLGVVLIMLAEGTFLGRQVLKLAAERFPGERTRGVRVYAALRAMQIRKLRMPAPRVQPGDTV